MFDIDELKNKIAVIGVGKLRARGIAKKIDGASRLSHPVLRVDGRNPWAQPALDDDPAGHGRMSGMGRTAGRLPRHESLLRQAARWRTPRLIVTPISRLRQPTSSIDKSRSAQPNEYRLVT